jgi:Spy/CpxP family protein refolding chaperone
MTPTRSRRLLLFFAFLPFTLLARASAPAPDPALVERAEKIVAALNLADAAQAARVRDVVAGQYAALRPVHEARDAAIEVAKREAGPGADKAATDAAIRTARDVAAARQGELHYAFLARLSAELAPEQVEKIKDGMTYGVLPNTFKVYQEMLPDLTPEQSRQILAWLTEAREHAMDAGSSKEKHGWFGKYKGRINNYLAQAGYDMKKAERDMFARKKAAAEKAD